MASVQKSLRVSKKILSEIEQIAKENKKDFSSVTNELLEEAIKSHRCPGIVFTEGVKGKRARIAGTGLEVWEVIAAYQSIGGNIARLRRAYHWLTEQQLKATLGYSKLYSDEINELIAENEDWTLERIHQKHPFIVVDK